MSIHIASDKTLQRPGYIYGSNGIGHSENAVPEIVWGHIDGPLLYTSDHGLHWLTLWERFQMLVSLTDIHALDRKHKRRQS